MLGSFQTHFWAVRDYLSPILQASKFKESGRLTPEEFVAAGDFLVYKFPTWSWESGDVKKTRDFLPEGKQFLVNRNVPCLRRVSQLAYAGEGDQESETLINFGLEMEVVTNDNDQEWVATHTSKDPIAMSSPPIMGDIPDGVDSTEFISNQLAQVAMEANESKGKEEIPCLEDIPDMDDEELSEEEEDESGGGDQVVEEEDHATLSTLPTSSDDPRSDNLLRVRTYDCSITYDKYYQTPRMWLLGYDQHKSPLPPQSAWEDISTEHAKKTVTIEPFPHSNLSMASVHPCKHSSVMKKFIERIDKRFQKDRIGRGGGKGETGEEEEEEEQRGLRVDQYLVVFLKFMSSIVPTIEVDATAAF